MAASPLNRTMPIPAGDFAVDIAAIVIVVNLSYKKAFIETMKAGMYPYE